MSRLAAPPGVPMPLARSASATPAGLRGSPASMQRQHPVALDGGGALARSSTRSERVLAERLAQAYLGATGPKLVVSRPTRPIASRRTTPWRSSPRPTWS